MFRVVLSVVMHPIMIDTIILITMIRLRHHMIPSRIKNRIRIISLTVICIIPTAMIGNSLMTRLRPTIILIIVIYSMCRSVMACRIRLLARKHRIRIRILFMIHIRVFLVIRTIVTVCMLPRIIPLDRHIDIVFLIIPIRVIHRSRAGVDPLHIRISVRVRRIAIITTSVMRMIRVRISTITMHVIITTVMAVLRVSVFALFVWVALLLML